MNRKAILANVMVLAAVLGGCESTSSPIEPEPVIASGGPTQTPARTDLISSTLAGLEELALGFSASVPVGDEVAPGDSLTEVVTDLLGVSLNVAPSFSTSGTTNGTVQDGERIKVTGTTKVETSKVTYADGSTGYDQTITTSSFTMRGQNSGGECKSQENASFHFKPAPGATVFHQNARSAVVCPGDGRVYFVHLNIHSTTSSSGKVNSHTKVTCVSRSEEYPCT